MPIYFQKYTCCIVLLFYANLSTNRLLSNFNMDYKIRSAITILFLFFGALIPSQLLAADTLAFAGVTFQGSAKQFETLYPFSYSLIKEHKTSREIVKALIKNPPQNFAITPMLLDKDEGHRYALTLMVDGEYVSIEKLKVGNKLTYKTLAFVSAQLVMFDVEQLQFLAGIPLEPMRYTLTTRSYPTDSQIKNAFSESLFSKNETDPGLVPRFLSKVQMADSPAQANLTQFAVQNVIIEDKALPFLPEALKVDRRQLKFYIAQQVLKNLAVNQQVATQPFLLDGSVLRMQSRFTSSDGEFVLDLPKPAYVVDYTLRGFKKVQREKNNAGSNVIYGTYSRYQVTQKAGNEKVLFSQKLLNGANKIIPSSQSITDDWGAFRDSLLSLINKTATDLHVKKSAFYKAQKFTKNISNEIKALKKAYEQCKIGA